VILDKQVSRSDTRFTPHRFGITIGIPEGPKELTCTTDYKAQESYHNVNTKRSFSKRGRGVDLGLAGRDEAWGLRIKDQRPQMGSKISAVPVGLGAEKVKIVDILTLTLTLTSGAL